MIKSFLYILVNKAVQYFFTYKQIYSLIFIHKKLNLMIVQIHKTHLSLLLVQTFPNLDLVIYILTVLTHTGNGNWYVLSGTYKSLFKESDINYTCQIYIIHC